MQALSPVAILKAYDHAVSFSAQQFQPLTDFALAQHIARDVAQMRAARGEKPMGYKIGFTNRSIWPLYGVSRPIWSPIYDTTVTHLPGDHVQIGLSRFVEPRIEPEIVIGLKATPRDDSLAALQEAIGWVAHGFEIVQSHLPKWKFTAAEAHACQGLHGALLIGTKTFLKPGATGLADMLSSARMALCLSKSDPRAEHSGTALEIVEEGVGSNVLDGPLQALAFLVRGLKEEGRSLSAGDIVTTGTLTDAKPMLSGQSWRSYWLARAVHAAKLDGGAAESGKAGATGATEVTDDTERLRQARHHSYFLSDLSLDVI